MQFMTKTVWFLQTSLQVTLVLLLFSLNGLAQAQGISLSVSSSPLSVQLSGTEEVLGPMRLTAGSTGGPMTTQISTLQIWYQGVSISNPFAGSLAPNPANGVIFRPEGIVITFTGGYNNPAVTASVFNSTLATTPVGVVLLSFPGGLTISPGDFIDVNGVRANVAGKNEGDKIECLILAAPASSHVVNVVSATVAQVVNRNLRITTPSLIDGFIGVAYSQPLAATGGTPPYLWQVITGSLPTPLDLDPLIGVISGGPAVGGAFNFVVQVRDNTGAKASKSFSLNVQGLSIDRSGLDVGEAIIGTSLTRTITLSNVGTAPMAVSSSMSGSSAFTVSPQSFRVEAGKAQVVSVIFTPADANNGVPFTGQVNFFFSGIARFVTLRGVSRVSVAPLVSVLPASGPTVGNTRVRIRWPQSAPLGSPALGGVALSGLTQVGTDEWLGRTGPHAAGIVDLAITRSDGAVITIPNVYAYRELAKAVPEPGDLRISFVSDTAEFRSNLGVNNLSAEVADVAVSLLDNNGLVVARRSVSLPANGMRQINHILRDLEGADEVTGREGALLLHSSQPIRAWASQIDNVSLDPSLQRAISEGASRILVPSSAFTERFSTALVISNLANRDARLKIVARDRFGVAQLTLSDVDIAGQGFLYFEDFYRSHGLDQAAGPIEIEAAGDARLGALARIYSRQRTGGFFPGVPVSSAARIVVIPHVLDTLAFRTNLGINNPGSSGATVQIALVGMDGLTLGTFSDSVPAGTLVQWDNIQRLLLRSPTRTESEGWLRIESDREIVAWASQIDNSSQDPDFLSASRPSASRLLIPAAVSAGAFRSTLVLLNGDAAPNPVTLTVRGPDGDIRHVSSVSIPGNGLLVYADILESLGLGGTFGPLEIVSSANKSVLAISRVASEQHTGGLLRTEELP